MSSSSEGRDTVKAIALGVFFIGVFFVLVGVVLTIGAIWSTGGHNHGLGGKLGGTAAVSYIIGAVCALSGGAKRWDW
jgi:Kef-type K+ transport system membrane component KefB